MRERDLGRRGDEFEGGAGCVALLNGLLHVRQLPLSGHFILKVPLVDLRERVRERERKREM